MTTEYESVVRAAEEYGVVFVGDTLNIDGEATAVHRTGAVDDGD